MFQMFLVSFSSPEFTRFKSKKPKLVPRCCGLLLPGVALGKLDRVGHALYFCRKRGVHCKRLFYCLLMIALLWFTMTQDIHDIKNKYTYIYICAGLDYPLRSSREGPNSRYIHVSSFLLQYVISVNQCWYVFSYILIQMLIQLQVGNAPKGRTCLDMISEAWRFRSIQSWNKTDLVIRYIWSRSAVSTPPPPPPMWWPCPHYPLLQWLYGGRLVALKVSWQK